MAYFLWRLAQTVPGKLLPISLLALAPSHTLELYAKEILFHSSAFRHRLLLQELWEVWAVSLEGSSDIRNRSICQSFQRTGRCPKWKTCSNPHGRFCEV